MSTSSKMTCPYPASQDRLKYQALLFSTPGWAEERDKLIFADI